MILYTSQYCFLISAYSAVCSDFFSLFFFDGNTSLNATNKTETIESIRNSRQIGFLRKIVQLPFEMTSALLMLDSIVFPRIMPKSVGAGGIFPRVNRKPTIPRTNAVFISKILLPDAYEPIKQSNITQGRSTSLGIFMTCINKRVPANPSMIINMLDIKSKR